MLLSPIRDAPLWAKLLFFSKKKNEDCSPSSYYKFNYTLNTPPSVLFTDDSVSFIIWSPPAIITKSPFSSISFDFNFSIPASIVLFIVSLASTNTGVTFHTKPN